MRKYIKLLFVVFLAILSTMIIASLLPKNNNDRFDGQRAYQDVITQVSFGPRTVGSKAHDQTAGWIKSELTKAGWEVEIQSTSSFDHPIQNIIASRDFSAPVILLGAHYDSRLIADRGENIGDPSPVPGANDGASGVAVLLELARTLPKEIPSISLVFFDAEDNGNIPGWDWILGSTAYVSLISTLPKEVVIVDMVGDSNLNIYQENNSSPEIMESIWAQGNSLGYGEFLIPQSKYTILDDHIPFINSGIPSVLLIDFDYPYWHTTLDTVDKVSPESLEIVGNTLWAWIVSHK